MFNHLKNEFRQYVAGVVLCLILPNLSFAADIKVVDDTRQTIVLHHPAHRIISLAPNLTELLFAAGAGDAVVGVVQYSDYPEAAKKIDRVGSYNALDLEAILALKPDLIIAWQSGNPSFIIEKLKSLGLTVFLSEPHHFEDVASNLERIGRLSGKEQTAHKASITFLAEYKRLRMEYADRKKIKVFYQIWNRPLMTINGKHLISHVLELCGGENVFADLKTLAPSISLESVIVANPDAIITGGLGNDRAGWLDDWRKWIQITAVKYDNLFLVNPDIVQRHTPRILLGVRQVCEKLDLARSRMAKSYHPD